MTQQQLEFWTLTLALTILGALIVRHLWRNM